jgi:cell division protein FtsI (penicillin-binding protein 3)
MVDTASGDDSWELPGTARDAVAAVPGVQLKLTIDTDVQYQAEQLPALGTVVLGARTGEIYAYTGDRSAFAPGAVGAILGGSGIEARSGEQYSDLLGRFGLGQPVVIGLPDEATGTLPARNQSAAGLTASLLQLTSMYQAVADDGVRVPPRVVIEHEQPDGGVVPEPTPDGVRAISAHAAETIRGQNELTVLPGYQMAGRVGACGLPAQQHCAVAMVPADHPQFVIGLRSAEDVTPLLHRLAGYLVQHFQLPMS